jgi:hypothetical protein
MVAVQNLKGEIIQLVLSRKGGHVLHAHLQVVYYKCAKIHKNPISGLGGDVLTRYMDGRTDRQGDSYIPPNFACGGYNKQLFHPENQRAYLQNG